MSALLDLLSGAPAESPPAPARAEAPAADGGGFRELLEAHEGAEPVSVPLPLPAAPLPPTGEASLEGASLERRTNVPQANALVAELERLLQPHSRAVPEPDAMRRPETTDGALPFGIPRVAGPANADVANEMPALARLAHASIGIEARPTVSDERRDARGADERRPTASPRPDALATLRSASSTHAGTPAVQESAALERSEIPSRFEFVNERVDARPTETTGPAPLPDGTSLGAVRAGESTGGPVPVAGSSAAAVPTRVAWLAARGGGSARVTLHPAELGEVELSVRVRGNAVDVVITAEQPLARVALLDASDRFGEALATRELRIESLEIRMTETRGSGLGDPGTGSGSATGREGGFAQSDHEASTGRDGGRRPAVPETREAARPAGLRTDAAHLDLHV